MKYILSLLVLLYSLTLPAQVISTTVTKDLDTLIVSKVPKNKTIKVGKISYVDSTIVGDTTVTTLRPYKPPTQINLPPVANPGSPQTVQLPTVSINLNGNASIDPDGVITTYAWSKVTTLTGTLTSPASSTTEYRNFIAGTHRLRLTVIDNNGTSSFKDVDIVVLPASSGGTTINLSFTPIPYTDPDIISPGRGAEQWHNGSARISNPTESQPISTENSLDVYHRFEAWRLYNSDGTFNWSYFDGLVEGAINKGQKLSFGIMTYNGDDGGGTNYGGAESAYPASVHNQMQSESIKDWITSDGEWCANYNSQSYISWLRSMHTGIASRLKTERHTPTSGPNAGKSVLYGDAIYVIDIRGYGNWGEWHTGQYTTFNGHPSGQKPTEASLIAIIDAHTQIFDRWPLGMMIAAYDGGKSGVQWFHNYPRVAHYALTARNAWGEVGARRDQVGAPDGYLKVMLEGNDLTYNGSPTFSSLFLSKWMKAPITGEPNPGVAAATSGSEFTGTNSQINRYHHVSFGNGNYPFGSQLNLTTKNNIREGFKRSGYRIQLIGGKIVTNSGAIAITLYWQNVGITPTYENWDVVFEAVSSTGVVTTLGTSSFKPKLFLPATLPTEATDNLVETLSGTYKIRVRIKDPANYRANLPIAINGRNTDGSYNLGDVNL